MSNNVSSNSNSISNTVSNNNNSVVVVYFQSGSNNKKSNRVVRAYARLKPCILIIFRWSLHLFDHFFLITMVFKNFGTFQAVQFFNHSVQNADFRKMHNACLICRFRQFAQMVVKMRKSTICTEGVHFADIRILNSWCSLCRNPQFKQVFKMPNSANVSLSASIMLLLTNSREGFYRMTIKAYATPHRYFWKPKFVA